MIKYKLLLKFRTDYKLCVQKKYRTAGFFCINASYIAVSHSVTRKNPAENPAETYAETNCLLYHHDYS